MRKTKFIRILRTLDSSELLQFQKLVLTPYFNKNKNIQKLLKYCMTFSPDFDDEALEDESAHRFIFPREKYEPSKRVITKLSSKLLALLVQYISLERHLVSSFETNYNLLLHYRDYNLMDEFHLMTNKIKQNHSKEVMTPTTYYENFLVERELNRVISRTTDNGTGDVNFENASDALDKYYIYNKLIYTCQKINRGNVIMDYSYQNHLVQILDAIPETPYLESPQIRLWYNAYKLLSSKDEQEKRAIYLILKKELLEEKVPLSVGEIRNIFSYLENYVIYYFKDQMYSEIYDLHSYQNKHGILLNDKTAVPHLIKNYVVVLLHFNKYDEADEFLSSNKEDILPLFEGHYQLCRALIAFERADYDQSLSILNSLSLKNIYLKINEKRLRIKIYYHLGFHDLLYDNINSFRVFLTNNKDSIQEFHLNYNRNFINLFSKIQKANGQKSNDFLQKINETKEMTEKKWLKSIIYNSK